MKFKIIACINSSFCLGKKNGLLYKIPNDLANFKRITNNGVVIMGRSTFESLPGKKPLKNRINVILTTDTKYKVDADNVFVAHTISEVIDLCNKEPFKEKNCFVIGGASVYAQFLANELVDEMYITTVKDHSAGDAYFPDIFKDGNWDVFYDGDYQSFSPIDYIKADSIPTTDDWKILKYKFTIYKRK